MSTITTLAGTDGVTTANSMTKINTNFTNLNADKEEVSNKSTDTTFADNSDTKYPSQKATKAYVDASVNPTGRSWNEYAADAGATDAYAITLTGLTAYATGQTFKFKANTANTGACTLKVNSLAAITIKKDVSSDLATGDILANQIVTVVYDGTNMQLVSVMSGVKDATQLTGLVPTASLPTPAFYQRLAVTGLTSSGSPLAVASTTDGSVLVILDSATSLKRYLRDTNTGMYRQTHNVDPTSANVGYASSVIVGDYVYLFSDEDPFLCYRYLVADLTGETLMTIPSIDVAGANYRSRAWTDGTFIYVVVAKASTTAYKLSISGTTLTTVTTDTTAVNLTENNPQIIFDGTNIYQVDMATDITIKKFVTAFGATFTTTTYPNVSESDYSSTNAGSIPINIDTNRMYVGRYTPSYDEAAQVKVIMTLTPYTKP